MAEKSAISWCRSTFNPWIGCTKVGPGCDHCYAAVSTPARAMKIKWGPAEPRHRTSASNWGQPLKWNKLAPESEFVGLKGYWPVFCASLADVFDNEVPDEWRKDLFDLIEATPSLSWLLVTKRIGNVQKMAYRWTLKGWPANVRLLITVVNQEEADRDIPKLLAIPCKNGISYEPALGPVDWTQWLAHQYPGSGVHIDWIIIGGESDQGGAKARLFDVAWARNTIAQCKATGVPVFVKQLGSFVATRNDDEFDDWPNFDSAETEHDIFGYCEQYQGALCRLPLNNVAGSDPAEWPKDLCVQEFPV